MGLGYARDAAATRRRFFVDARTGERFFRTGDLGCLDADGFLRVTGRLKDVIIRKGENVSAQEIEDLLYEHSKVADVAVFGIPNDDWGEEIKAVVQTIDGVQPGESLTDEIFTWCKDRLAKMKTPRTIDYVDELPRDPNGKLYKRKLRDPYWKDRERAI